ncbi:MAG: DUF2029 domain-containing protein [Rhodobacteraceae bacterium]|nr:DUF2029 domain-containing protein [Paracoccaceae bacterium]
MRRDAGSVRRWLSSSAVLGALGLALLAACGAALVPVLDYRLDDFVRVSLAHAAVYAIAVAWILRNGAGRGVLVVTLLVAALARAIALPAPPALSNDALRYIWDGRVQAAGVNPYLYVPADERLAPLRDGAIYPHINRKDYAPTIYPPAAQMIFLAATRFGESFFVMKLAMVTFEALAIVAIMAWLVALGLPRARVLIYAWHPLPIWEFAGTGHIDAAAIAFLCLALAAAQRGRQGWTGIALAAGTLVKVFPLVLAPALWRRWNWRMPTAFLAACLLFYLPYLGAGERIFGFAVGFSDEEGFRDGRGFYLVALARALGLPSPSGAVFAAAGLLVLAALAAAIVLGRQAVEPRPMHAIALASAFLVITSPHYAWYFAWAIPLLCRAFYLPLAYVSLACVLLYLPADTVLGGRLVANSVIYGGFFLLAAAELVTRRRTAYGGDDDDHDPRL